MLQKTVGLSLPLMQRDLFRKVCMNLFQSKHLPTTLSCLVLAIGALFLAQLPNDTQSDWFRSLIRPEILPRSIERKIGLIWSTIFVLAGLGTASALASVQDVKWKRLQVGLILGALILNLYYTFTFTYRRDLWLSTLIAATLALLLLFLLVSTARRRQWFSTLCHMPHFGWVCFATYVTAKMASLN